MFSSWLNASLVAYRLLLLAEAVSGDPGGRLPASPGYRNIDRCPERCDVVGPNPANWSTYRNLKQFESCPLGVIQAFSIYDDVDNESHTHGIYACSSYGPDFSNKPKTAVKENATYTVDATYELGWGNDDHRFRAADIRSASQQLRKYITSGHGATKTAEILYAQAGRAAAGLYLGQGLQNEGVTSVALKYLEDNLNNFNITSRTLAIQFCGPGHTSEHIFGFFATSNRAFAPIQQAIRSWSNGTCLKFPHSKNFKSKAALTSSLTTTSISNATYSGTKSTTNSTNSFRPVTRYNRTRWKLHARSECKTIKVQSGDSCGSLAKKCGISGDDFTKYNGNKGLCSKLAPGQHVCCSVGDMPDFKPKPNKDGSCKSYYVIPNDNCAKIAATNSITIDDLEKFNNKTWAWNGCKNLQFNLNICLSKGDPPMPASLANAICGPQVANTKKPTKGTKLADLNPCPLNACCDVWGQCGVTAEFCTDTGTGNPGTAKPGTNGCISNCGTKVVKSDAPSTFRKVAYFEGYGLKRKCLFQDVHQIDGSQYTHLHFAFGTLTSGYKVEVGDVLSSYQFEHFRYVKGPARILSLGGWAFSTEPATYKIFREGVTSANRLKMATSIANFIKEKGLDGVDIDWEYPGAPDIPGIPAASQNDGKSYLEFLKLLKNLLPGKSVSIAAPSSYWYLKAFPIKDIAKVVDYIVFMTYDLHGQWDTGNPNSQEGCANGNCLRSQVNMTETMNALAMITKAGVPSNKVVVGVTSYGRSFKMAKAGCDGPDCFFTGTKSASDAKKGICTETSGYISNAEIKEITNNKTRVTKHFVDKNSDSNILVYDSTQWVAYMGDDVRANRHKVYSSLNLGGTTNWATDLEKYNEVPGDLANWSDFKLNIKSGKNPWQVGNRTGNWTDLSCESQAAADFRHLSPSQRWDQLDCVDAWRDVIDIWKKIDKKETNFTFTESVADNLNAPPKADCGILGDPSNCRGTVQCTQFQNVGSGPAGWEIWNSFVLIHGVYQAFDDALYKAAAGAINPSLADFTNKFAPIPPEKDNKELLLLLDLITVGVSSVAAPFFNSYFKNLAYFTNEARQGKGYEDNVKDLTLLAIGQSTTIAKDLLHAPENQWNEESQDTLASYLGQTTNAWGNTSAAALRRLFNGDDENIENLYSIISDGKLISGNSAESKPPPDSPDTPVNEQLKNNIAKAFFAYAIPSSWTLSKHYAFIIDSGYGCNAKDPLKDYLDTAQMQKSGGCYDNKLYYLAAAKGDSKKSVVDCNEHECETLWSNSHFPAPPGIEYLDGTSFGGVTVKELIEGSVRTYIQNGNENGGKFADITNGGTFSDMMANDLTTPGFIRLSVCSPDRAYRAWDSVDDPSADPLFPCSAPKGVDHCGASTFVDQTSNASPDVSDCLQIIKNIEMDANTEWYPGIGPQKRLVSYGHCEFGVESKSGADGNVRYKIGGQDVIDLINSSIKQFGGGGKVGAKGVMRCDGNVHSTTIEWGIY